MHLFPGFPLSCNGCKAKLSSPIWHSRTSFSRSPAHRTWSGAWLRTLGWLAQEGGAPGDILGDYLRRARGALATGTLGALRTKLLGWGPLPGMKR